MGGGQSCIHVANASSMPIKAKISHEKMRLMSKEVNHNFGVGGGGTLEVGSGSKPGSEGGSKPESSESQASDNGNQVLDKVLDKVMPSVEIKGKVGVGINYNYESKKHFQGFFIEEGFAAIEPKDVLGLYCEPGKKAYVSVYIEDSSCEGGYRSLCNNTVIEKNRSLLVKNRGVTLSEQTNPKKLIALYQKDSHGSSSDDDEVTVEIPTWVTEDGLCYSADMAGRVFRQEDVNKAAERYRKQKEILSRYSTDSASIQKDLESVETDAVEDKKEKPVLIKIKDSKRETGGLKVRPVQDCLYAMDGGSVRKVRALNMQKDSVGDSSGTDIEFEMKRTRISNNEMEIVISVKKQP